MTKRWQRPPISRFEVLVALSEAPREATTECVLEQVASRHSRHQIYYALTKLDQDEYVEKDLVFGMVIAHAYWKITEKGWAALGRGELDAA